MKDVAPSPEFLPVSVDIHVQDKDMKIKGIIIKPTDTLKELKEVCNFFLFYFLLFPVRLDSLVRFVSFFILLSLSFVVDSIGSFPFLYFAVSFLPSLAHPGSRSSSPNL
jgi:hypothetical protein